MRPLLPRGSSAAAQTLVQDRTEDVEGHEASACWVGRPGLRVWGGEQEPGLCVPGRRENMLGRRLGQAQVLDTTQTLLVSWLKDRSPDESTRICQLFILVGRAAVQQNELIQPQRDVRSFAGTCDVCLQSVWVKAETPGTTGCRLRAQRFTARCQLSLPSTPDPGEWSPSGPCACSEGDGPPPCQLWQTLQARPLLQTKVCNGIACGIQ